MFEMNDRGEVPFQNAVKCAIATLTDKIISSENDLVGVCFYGTVRTCLPRRANPLQTFSQLFYAPGEEEQPQ
jgi:hypothetical protein